MTDAELSKLISEARDSLDVQDVWRRYWAEKGAAVKDADGIYHGTDERLEIDANAVREETMVLGNRQYTLIGNKRQRDAMRHDLMQAFAK